MRVWKTSAEYRLAPFEDLEVIRRSGDADFEVLRTVGIPDA